jgi:hypothetical protein
MSSDACKAPKGFVQANSEILEGLVTSRTVRNITADATAGDGGLILADATGGAITVTLPAVADAGEGAAYLVKKTDASGNAVTIDGSGAETIDGGATVALAAQNDFAEVFCDGTEWWVVATNV